jgi:hypothetical protein
VPFRVFGSTGCFTGSRRNQENPLMELACGLEFYRRNVLPLLVGNPTMLLAVSSALWSSDRVGRSVLPEGRQA